MYPLLSLWLHRAPITQDLLATLSRRDVPKSELPYYEAIESQFSIMLAEGGRTANTLYALTVFLLPKVAPMGSVWVLRIPLIALWTVAWKKIYFFGADFRVHLGLPTLLREMQATGQTSLARKAGDILQKCSE